jgi:hypothetical protein
MLIEHKASSIGGRWRSAAARPRAVGARSAHHHTRMDGQPTVGSSAGFRGGTVARGRTDRRRSRSAAVPARPSGHRAPSGGASARRCLAAAPAHAGTTPASDAMRCAAMRCDAMLEVARPIERSACPSRLERLWAGVYGRGGAKRRGDQCFRRINAKPALGSQQHERHSPHPLAVPHLPLCALPLCALPLCALPLGLSHLASV